MDTALAGRQRTGRWISPTTPSFEHRSQQAWLAELVCLSVMHASSNSPVDPKPFWWRRQQAFYGRACQVVTRLLKYHIVKPEQILVAAVRHQIKHLGWSHIIAVCRANEDGELPAVLPKKRPGTSLWKRKPSRLSIMLGKTNHG